MLSASFLRHYFLTCRSLLYLFLYNVLLSTITPYYYTDLPSNNIFESIKKASSMEPSLYCKRAVSRNIAP